MAVCRSGGSLNLRARLRFVITIVALLVSAQTCFGICAILFYIYPPCLLCFPSPSRPYKQPATSSFSASSRQSLLTASIAIVVSPWPTFARNQFAHHGRLQQHAQPHHPHQAVCSPCGWLGVCLGHQISPVVQWLFVLAACGMWHD